MGHTIPPFRPRYPSPSPTMDEIWAGALIQVLERRDRTVSAVINIVELTDTFAIDSTGIKTITISNKFGFIPQLKDCQVSIVEETAVDDWAYDLLKVSSITDSQVVIKINVSSASVTGSATARVVFWMRP